MAAPTQGTTEKATLTIHEPGPKGAAGKSEPVKLPFNPKEWSITYAADWKVETTKGKTPPPEFKGPKPASVTVEIFLDACEDPAGDISKTVAKLKKLVVPEGKSVAKGTPSAPHVEFHWGPAIAFKGYVESVAVKYTMFRASGTPIRGTCTLAMKEFPTPKPGQNPSSGGMMDSRTHRMVTGDTLASVSYAEYGDPTRWRKIADANTHQIDDPMRIPAGTVLRVPPA